MDAGCRRAVAFYQPRARRPIHPPAAGPGFDVGGTNSVSLPLRRGAFRLGVLWKKPSSSGPVAAEHFDGGDLCRAVEPGPARAHGLHARRPAHVHQRGREFPRFSLKGSGRLRGSWSGCSSRPEKFGARLRLLQAVEGVDLSSSPFKLTVDGEVIESRTIIIATGAGHFRASPGWKAKLYWRKKGVTFCATCDGAWSMFSQPTPRGWWAAAIRPARRRLT